jgi:hypothetical protein
MIYPLCYGHLGEITSRNILLYLFRTSNLFCFTINLLEWIAGDSEYRNQNPPQYGTGRGLLLAELQIAEIFLSTPGINGEAFLVDHDQWCWQHPPIRQILDSEADSGFRGEPC